MKKLIIVVCILTSSLFAHKLNVFTTFEDNSLFVSAYFANGNGCQNCKVVIKSLDEKVINEGLTNTKGEYEVKLNNTEFKVGVDAGGGHLAFETVTAEVEESPVLKTEKFIKNNNDEFQKLKDENRKLRSEVKLLESQLQILELFKIIFGLLVIVGIFIFLKRIKK